MPGSPGLCRKGTDHDLENKPVSSIPPRSMLQLSFEFLPWLPSMIDDDLEMLAKQMLSSLSAFSQCLSEQQKSSYNTLLPYLPATAPHDTGAPSPCSVIAELTWQCIG